MDRQPWRETVTTREVETRLAIVEALGRRAQQWDLFGLERSDRHDVAAQVVPEALRLLAYAQVVLPVVDADDSPREGANATCADIVYFTLLEIERMRASFDALDPALPSWRVVQMCDRMRGQLIGASSALHQALCRQAGLTGPDPVRAIELARGLKLRDRYAEFRDQLALVKEAAGDDLLERLRLAAVTVAILIDSAEYHDMRVGDRVLVTQLQHGIVDWLGSPDQDRRIAARLWSDLVTFVQLSQAISQRAVLQEHDRDNPADSEPACGPRRARAASREGLAAAMAPSVACSVV
ncbi:MAG: hypothetical protein K0V04_04825 [Deltaproteobacteria bacterium]|nr:hypothetical protein [Deltaproteobacteria bacterium]